MVEFAILLPLMLLLAFGIVDFGRGFFSWLIITNGAREGARAAAVGKTPAQIAAVVQSAISGLHVTGVQTGSCTSGADGSLCITTTNAGGMMGEPVAVTVRYNFRYMVLPNVMAMSGATSLPAGIIPLTAQATMRLE